MQIVLLAAVAENGVVGRGGVMPWRLKSDMRHFRELTLGKPVVMGRKTYDSLHIKPLPNRTNIVVTRQEGYQPDGVLVISSFEAALEHAQEIARADRANEVMIGGGAEIYAQALAIADRLYITHVGAMPEGDAYFPQVNLDLFKESGTIDVPANPNDSAAFRIKVYRRAPNARR